MLQTFANLPEPITQAISAILSQQPTPEWVSRSQSLHQRYINQEKDPKFGYIQDSDDAMSYLGLRTAATYAQIYGAFLQIQELLPHWKPKTMLDIGSGPGTGVWAAKTIWPMLKSATCLDRERRFLSIGKAIQSEAQLDITLSWQLGNAAYVIENDTTQYDIVVIANMLDELEIPQREHLIGSAFNHRKGIMLILEPGTPLGSSIVEHAAKSLSHTQIIAPYSNNTLIHDDNHWLHFSQRFIRPEFLRRIRQHMREESLMASDWEEAKYSYVAFGKDIQTEKIWGRCIGDPTFYKGYLQVPILTDKGIESIKVMKRHKTQYVFAKKLRWGDTISTQYFSQEVVGTKRIDFISM